MPVKAEWISYGNRSGYLAVPERAALPLPAVVVIQEIWGVDEHIQDVTRRIAAAGYAALAPDLWAEHGERPAARSQVHGDHRAQLGRGVVARAEHSADGPRDCAHQHVVDGGGGPLPELLDPIERQRRRPRQNWQVPWRNGCSRR